MFQYILKRLLGLLPVLFGITLLVFMFLHLIPGAGATVLLGEGGTPPDINSPGYIKTKETGFFSLTADYSQKFSSINPVSGPRV